MKKQFVINKGNAKQLKNMKIMLEGFQEINKLCEPTIFDLPFPDVEAINRYYKILDILQNVNDNLK